MEEKGKDTLRLIGIYTVLLFVFINVVVLLNVVIAMMADTYAMMTSVRRGIYNYNIIKFAPSYLPDKHYGGLIVYGAPVNMIVFLLLPVFLCLKDKRKLERFNNFLYLVYYALLSVPLGTIFVAANLILSPFAYLKTCANKLKLVRLRAIPLTHFFVYVLLGLFILTLAQLTDLVAYLRVSFSRQKIQLPTETHVITQNDFNLF